MARGEEPFPPVAPRTANGQSDSPFDLMDRAAAVPAQERPDSATTRSPSLPRSEPVPLEPPVALADTAGITVKSAPSDQSNRAQSDRLLVAARKALAVGDAVQASRLAAQAKALAVQYGLHEDNPARVETTIQKYVELTQRAGSKDGEVYRRRYADLLMAQAEALLAWKEFDAAERLTDDAQRLSVTYGPFDAKPEDLLKRLATARRRGGHFRDGAVAPAGVEASVGGSVTEPEAAATVSPRQRAQQSATPSQVAQSRAAPRSGRFTTPVATQRATCQLPPIRRRPQLPILPRTCFVCPRRRKGLRSKSAANRPLKIPAPRPTPKCRPPRKPRPNRCPRVLNRARDRC